MRRIESTPQVQDPHSFAIGLTDPAWFAKHQLGFTPDKQQEQLLSRRWRRCLLNCFRQWGKSTVTAAKAVHQAWHFPGSLTLVVSPVARQSGEFVEKAAEFLRRLGVNPRGDGHNDISLVLPNRSRIVGVPGKEGTIRGFSAASLLVIDEAGWVHDGIYHTVRPMLAKTGELWVMSTPNGQQGFFWQAWEFGEDWQRIKAKASENARVTQAEIARNLSDLGMEKYLQEYECEFTQTEGGLVSRHAVDQMLAKEVTALRGDPWGELCAVVDGPRTNIAGKVELFLGVDLGQKMDYTAIAVLERYREVSAERDPKDFSFTISRRYDLRHLERIPLGKSWDSIVRRIAELSRAAARMGVTTIAVDATGVGSPVVELLRKETLGGSLLPVVITSGDNASVHGSTHRVPRLDLLDGLALQLENGELRVAHNIHHAPTLGRELLNLKRTHRSTGTSIGATDTTQHDDLVFATALACWASRKR